MSDAKKALRQGDHAALDKALERDPALARKAQLVVDAAGRADRRGLKVLVAHGADVNASWRNYRPLHALIQGEPHAAARPPTKARLDCLDWLLAHGADPEQLGAWPSMRAILVAAFGGEERYVEKLCEAGARVDGWVHASLGDVAAVRRELARDRAFATARDSGNLTALHCCAASRMGAGDARARGRLRDVAVLLLDHGADPGATVRSWGQDVDVCYFAIGADHLELFELLLERGADATAALPSALWHQGGDFVAFAELALRHGADANRARVGDRPILNELIRWGQFTPALWLLERGANPDVADARGWTALHQAASRGNERVFRALLEKGADPELVDANGCTPLDIARAKPLQRLITSWLRTRGKPASRG